MLETIVAAGITAVLTTVSALFVAKKRFEREQRLHFKVEALVHKLLSHEQWRLRTFETFRHHIGGFEDDELRKILLQSGALRFEDAKGVEIWGLMDRNIDLLENEFGTRNN